MASVIFAPSTLYGARQAPGATALIKNGLRLFTTPSFAGQRRREAHLGHHLCCFSYQVGFLLCITGWLHPFFLCFRAKLKQFSFSFEKKKNRKFPLWDFVFFPPKRKR
jgi:hypothetical protein